MFEFGDRILVKASIKRIHGTYTGENKKRSPNHREWVRTEHFIPKYAIFLGSRTLSNGFMEVDPDPEGGDYFLHTEYIKGAWICQKGRNPEKVFLSDCIKIDAYPNRLITNLSVPSGY